ncbi:MAG: bifunctional 4-hydroxy-3-methylbut-2-enyl diphosphate reductase/30S ribosomal protein S1, partial [Clostridia bacterium]|nr:bifunctional 4-hydroxy-3-methylbut-2-enyl diphosphate reductase/30S ribosomal protein S1 [Clostridia bacterium]
MKVTVAETAGFCFGVDRAVNLVYRMVESGRRVCTLGPIIHNPQVIEDLENKGVKIIDSPDEVPEGYEVVIRAHGVSVDVINSLRSNSVNYTDATCPYVLKIHNLIKKHSNETNTVLIAGDENHPEVCGFRSYCKGESFVFRNEAELTETLNKYSYLENKEII